MPDVSRSRLQQWVADAAVRVNGATVRQRHELVLGDLIEIEPQPAPDAKAYAAEPMVLAIVHEDSDILVVDKPPGLVVHPAAGHWSGTLLNGLLAHSPQLFDVPRAGIVHRLDADTSGLMVVAKTLAAQAHLVRQLQERSVTREYWAVVLGEPTPAGVGRGADRTRSAQSAALPGQSRDERESGADALRGGRDGAGRDRAPVVDRLPSRHRADAPDPGAHGTHRTPARR